MGMKITDKVWRKFLFILLISTASWIIVSESKSFLIETLSLSRLHLFLIAIGLLILGAIVLKDWFKY